MSSFGNLMKSGWHPEKEGTTFKGQVNGLLGRNKDKDDRSGHVARPLSSLQDPSTFAPPPRRVPGSTTPLPPPPRSNATSPGVPPPSYEDSNRHAGNYYQQQPAEEEEAPPPQPFRVDTTGLSTAHLPPPPGRKDGADGRTPVPGKAAAAQKPPPPSLPPRLPPRNPSTASSAATSPGSPAPTASGSGGGGGGGGGFLNQSAMNRLGAAGVSVPSLGIGRSAAPETPARSNSSSPAPMNELQNRFAKLGKSSSRSSTPPPPSSEGTTLEQKQAALRTASNFHKDPSSVSLADARSAASTFNNFRQRHGDQVTAGVRSANNLNQKYGIADKVGNYAGQHAGQQQQEQQQQAGGASSGATSTGPLSASSAVGLVNALGKKRPPPPPPPKKKPQLGGASQSSPSPGDDDAPPPIPLATKPTF